MIADSITKYRFKDPIVQIHQFCPAFDNSLVVLALKNPGEDHLYHYDKEATLIFDHNFGDFVESMCMPDDKYCVIPIPEENNVYIFDMKNHEKMLFSYEFMMDLGCHCQVDYFC